MYRYLLRPNLRLWLAIVGTSTLVLGATYTLVQQSTRLAADDWPLAATQLVSRELAAGDTAGDAVAAVAPIKTDLQTNVAGFVIITDDNLKIQASSLSGDTPLPPQGVFDYTKAHGTNQRTWQTATGVRIAMETLAYKTSGGSGYIIAGQPLKPAEDRIARYGLLAGAAWIAVLAWSWLTLLLPIKVAEIAPRKK